jgi:hypothetical protein
MLRRVIFASILALLAVTAAAQTTYTVTQNSCGGKSNMYCSMPVTPNTPDGAGIVVLDLRGGNPDAGNLYVGAFISTNAFPGTVTGFVANPDGTRHPFFGSASFESNDGTVSGTFLFYAYYASTCSGRGCGGTLGWHYQIQMGSTITVD